MITIEFHSSQVPTGAPRALKALCSITCFSLLLFATVAWAQSDPQYGSMTACNGATVGTPTYGPNGGGLNSFVPFPSTNMWNTNISGAAIDPNSATLMAQVGASTKLHPLFGQYASDGGIPYTVVDSSITTPVGINVIDYATESEDVVAPYPAGDYVAIEGDPTDCAGWPDTYIGDNHTLVLDRHTCWIYETFQTNRCNGYYDVASETIWDGVNYNARPWGWTSADAAGLSIFAGTLKYTEAASGTVSHAVRFTMDPTLGDSNGGYFVLPASHAASSNTTANLLPEGARLRLRSSVNISGYSAINQAILNGLKNFGMILADNGSNFFFIGDTDPNWNDSDLGNLHAITASDFDVIQMTPEYKGMDSSSAPSDYPETAPTIASFSATPTSVTSGSSVTFSYTVDGTNYDANFGAETGVPYIYIDNIGPLRLSGTCPCSGSVTITPTATQTYTLYALNTASFNNAAQRLADSDQCDRLNDRSACLQPAGRQLCRKDGAAGGAEHGQRQQRHGDVLLHHQRVDANDRFDEICWRGMQQPRSGMQQQRKRRIDHANHCFGDKDPESHCHGARLRGDQRGEFGGLHHRNFREEGRYAGLYPSGRDVFHRADGVPERYDRRCRCREYGLLHDRWVNAYHCVDDLQQSALLRRFNGTDCGLFDHDDQGDRGGIGIHQQRGRDGDLHHQLNPICGSQIREPG